MPRSKIGSSGCSPGFGSGILRATLGLRPSSSKSNPRFALTALEMAQVSQDTGPPWREAKGSRGTPSSWPRPSRLPASEQDRVPWVARLGQGLAIPAATTGAWGRRLSSPFPLYVRADGPGDVTGLSAWGRCRDDSGVKPKAPVQGTTSSWPRPSRRRPEGMPKLLGSIAPFRDRLTLLTQRGALRLRSSVSAPFTFPEGRHVFHDTGFAVP